MPLVLYVPFFMGFLSPSVSSIYHSFFSFVVICILLCYSSLHLLPNFSDPLMPALFSVFQDLKLFSSLPSRNSRFLSLVQNPLFLFRSVTPSPPLTNSFLHVNNKQEKEPEERKGVRRENQECNRTKKM